MKILPVDCARPSSGYGGATVCRPKPRYMKPEVTLPMRVTSAVNFESTDQIREATFQTWLANRKTQFRRRASELTLREKELEEQKAKVFHRKFFNSNVSVKNLKPKSVWFGLRNLKLLSDSYLSLPENVKISYVNLFLACLIFAISNLANSALSAFAQSII